MPSSRPFIEPATGALDTDRILAEAIPIAKLMALFAGIGLIPYGLLFLGLGGSLFGPLLAILGQFVLAIGTATVLLYVVARGRQLSAE